MRIHKHHIRRNPNRGAASSDRNIKKGAVCMAQPLKNLAPSPKSFRPKIPEILKMASEQEQYTETVIDTVVIEGTEFCIVEKGKRYYAGAYGTGKNLDHSDEPNINALWYYYHANHAKIIGTVSTGKIVVSQYYVEGQPQSMMIGHETQTKEQPEGIHVYEAAPCTFITVKNTKDARALYKKLIGQELGGLWHLFGLVGAVFYNDTMGYEGNHAYLGNYDYENYGADGGDCVAVPVKKKTGRAWGGAGIPCEHKTIIQNEIQPIHKANT